MHCRVIIFAQRDLSPCDPQVTKKEQHPVKMLLGEKNL